MSRHIALALDCSHLLDSDFLAIALDFENDLSRFGLAERENFQRAFARTKHALQEILNEEKAGVFFPVFQRAIADSLNAWEDSKLARTIPSAIRKEINTLRLAAMRLRRLIPPAEGGGDSAVDRGFGEVVCSCFEKCGKNNEDNIWPHIDTALNHLLHHIGEREQSIRDGLSLLSIGLSFNKPAAGAPPKVELTLLAQRLHDGLVAIDVKPTSYDGGSLVRTIDLALGILFERDRSIETCIKLAKNACRRGKKLQKG